MQSVNVKQVFVRLFLWKTTPTPWIFDFEELKPNTPIISYYIPVQQRISLSFSIRFSLLSQLEDSNDLKTRDESLTYSS